MNGPTKTIPVEEDKTERVPVAEPQKVEIINGIRSDDPEVQSIPWVNETFVNEEGLYFRISPATL